MRILLLTSLCYLLINARPDTYQPLVREVYDNLNRYRLKPQNLAQNIREDVNSRFTPEGQFCLDDTYK